MESNGKAKSTLENYAKLLKYVSKNTNLENPQEVKHFISKVNGGNGYKKNLCLAYNQYCQYYNITWEMPSYIPNPKRIRIPTTKNLSMLIACAGQTLSIKLSLSKETGLRPTEVMNLQVKDIDLEQKTVYPTTAKHGAPRILKINNILQATLENHINTNKLNLNDKLFKGTTEDYGKNYRSMRNSLGKN